MLKVYEQITGMKKAATKRENEKKELADVIEQDRLIEMKGKLLATVNRIIELISRSTSLRSQKCIPSSAGRGQEDGW